MSDDQSDKPGKDEVKRGGRLDLNPKIEVSTSIGSVFLSEDRDALAEFTKQPAGEVLQNIRRYVVRLASATHREKWNDARIPLTDSQAEALSDEDIERMAEAHLGTKNNLYFIAEGRKAKPFIVRGDGESAISFLDRILRFRVVEERDVARKTLESLAFGGNALKTISEQMRRENSALDEFKKIESISSGGSIAKALEQMSRENSALNEIKKLESFGLSENTKRLIDQTYGRSGSALAELNKQAHGLSDFASTLRQQNHFDDLRNSIAPTPPELKLDMSGIEVAQRIARERRQERDEDVTLARSMQDMTVRSAEHLAKLSQTTATMLGEFGDFLAKFVDSSHRADKRAQIGIGIAAISLFVSAVLTGVGVYGSHKSYQQDTSNNQSSDKWQKEVSDSLRKQVELSEQSVRALAAENLLLRQKIEAMEKTTRSGKWVE